MVILMCFLKGKEMLRYILLPTEQQTTSNGDFPPENVLKPTNINNEINLE